MFPGAPGWLSWWSMRLLDLGVVSSSPTLVIEITFFFFFSVFLAVSIFGCLSDVPILLLVFILYLDLEKSWIQSIPVYLYGPCGTFDSSVSILCKCLGVIFLKFKEGHNFSHQKPFQRSDPFSLFHLFSSISVTFRVFC